MELVNHDWQNNPWRDKSFVVLTYSINFNPGQSYSLISEAIKHPKLLVEKGSLFLKILVPILFIFFNTGWVANKISNAHDLLISGAIYAFISGVVVLRIWLLVLEQLFKLFQKIAVTNYKQIKLPELRLGACHLCEE